MPSRCSSARARAVGRGRAGLALLAGGLQPAEVERAVRAHRAEVVHAHNIHPLFGARALAAARRAGARVVMHLHNYRLVCAIAIDYRDGEVCLRCQGRNTLPGVRLRCRGNLPEAAAYGAGLALQQRRTIRAVDRFVAPSAFAAAAPRRPACRHRAHRGRCTTSWPTTSSRQRRPPGAPRHALFAGRLAEEKGADTAILASARVRRAARDRGLRARRGAARAAGAGARGAGHVPRPHLARADGRGACARGLRGCPVALGRAVSLRRDRGDGGGAAGARVRAGRAARDGGAGARAARSRRRSAGRRR